MYPNIRPLIAIVLAASCSGVGGVHAQNTYSPTLINPMPGHFGSSAAAIDNSTQVVGWSGTVTAYSYSAAGTVALPDHLGGFSSRGEGIGAAGQPLGSARTATSFDHATVWTPQDGGGYVATDLGVAPGDVQSIAVAMNANGDACGCTDDAINYRPGFFERIGASYTASRLPLLHGDTCGIAWDIDNAGTVVGFSASIISILPIRWTRSDAAWTPNVLPGLGPNSSGTATGINASGAICGDSFSQQTGFEHVVAWVGSNVVDLGHLPNDNSYGVSINSRNDVVGYSIDIGSGTQVAILKPSFTDTTAPIIDLNTTLPPSSPWVLTRANDINDRGEIVGEGVIGGFTQSFLLTPIVTRIAGPTPGTPGLQNTLTATNATPGNTVYFWVATAGGQTVLPGCTTTLDLTGPVLLGDATASANGGAASTFFVPASAAGQTWLFQALDFGACRVSDVRQHTF